MFQEEFRLLKPCLTNCSSTPKVCHYYLVLVKLDRQHPPSLPLRQQCCATAARSSADLLLCAGAEIWQTFGKRPPLAIGVSTKDASNPVGVAEVATCTLREEGEACLVSYRSAAHCKADD